MTKYLAPTLFCAAATLCCGQGVIGTVAGNGGNTATGDGGAAIAASFRWTAPGISTSRIRTTTGSAE